MRILPCSNLTTLKLTYRNQVADFDISLANQIPVKSVRKLHLQFCQGSLDHFAVTFTTIFPNVKRIEIECDDQEFKETIKFTVPSKHLKCI